MTSKNHDTLVYRLAQILVKLNQGERLAPTQLAEEFGVDLRTIQRDLNIRFAYLPLQKTEGRYHLDPLYLGKLSTGDIERFASLAGVRGLFPSLGKEFFTDIFDARLQTTLLVKGHNYEDLTGKENLFKTIELAITAHQQIGFNYTKHDNLKFYDSVNPYKLINNKGIWYLAAVDGTKLKTFSFTKISSIQTLHNKFAWNPDIESRLKNDDSIWISEARQKVILEVSHEITHYFKRRKLIANQVIEKELSDGRLIISSEIGHDNQVLPIVRYWIPYIKIISPVELQQEFIQILNRYLENQR